MSNSPLLAHQDRATLISTAAGYNFEAGLIYFPMLFLTLSPDKLAKQI